MKIHKTNNKKIVLILAAAVIIIAGVGAYLFLKAANTSLSGTSNRPISSPSAYSPNLSPPTDQEKEAGEQAKTNTVNTDSDTVSNPADATTIQLTASAQNGSIYQIRILIQDLVSGGNCVLSLTQGNKVVTKTAPIQSLSQSSTCQGFDIPVSELSTGTWQLKLSLNGSSRNGSLSGSIQVQ